MYKQNKWEKTGFKVNESYEGIPIEAKIRRIVNNKEPITDGAPLVYTERKEGVRPETNIRTDRFEVAIDAMDKVAAAHKAKREGKAKSVGEQAKEGMEKEGEKSGNPETGVNSGTDPK